LDIFRGDFVIADSGTSIFRESRKAGPVEGNRLDVSEVLASALAGYLVAMEPKGRYS